MRRLRKAPLPATTNGTCYGDFLETEADGGDWDEAVLLVLRIDAIRELLCAPRFGEPFDWCEMVSRTWIRPPVLRSSGELNLRYSAREGLQRSAHLRSYWTSDCEILSTGHSLCALITRTCDPSDRLMRACEHVLSSIFLTSISVVGSHCKVSPKSAGHMRHAEQSLNSTIKHSSCFVIRITNLPHSLMSCVRSSLTFR